MAELAVAHLRPRFETSKRWYSRGFGVDLDFGFPAPALPRLQRQPDQARATRFELVYAEGIKAVWPAEESQRTGLMGPPERPVMTVDQHPTAGYLIQLVPYGRYLLSMDGRTVSCAPPAVAQWYWQRLLIGQILPAVAALRGQEVLHASAVSFQDHAIAFAGEPGLGKSSLALQFLIRGHGLLAEDVLAVKDRDGQLLAEPGAGMVNLRHREFGQLGNGALASIAEYVGRTEDKVHLLVPRESKAIPLGVLYLLEPGGTGEPTFEVVNSPTFADLFANSFVGYMIRADRLTTQLHMAAEIARTVPIFRLRIQPGTEAVALADQVEAHAKALL